jgi:hypothetical protein
MSISGNTVNGVGKDAPTVTNENGAKQSKVLYRFDLLDPRAMFKMTEVLKEGAEKYGEDNWRGIPIQDHLNHMIIHAYAYLAGDKSDDHLSHIMCRAMFAQAVDIDGGLRGLDKSLIENYELTSDGLFIMCGMCRKDTISKTEGMHKCSECDTWHSVKARLIGSKTYYNVERIKPDWLY